MGKTIHKILDALRERHLTPWFADTSDEAQNLILTLVPADAIVGIGDSSTVRQIGIVDKLIDRGNKVINPFNITKIPMDQESYFRFLFWPSLIATLSDVFITGTNAITEDGKIINIDGAGNRVSGMIWGHPKSIIVIGKNKITKDLDDAFNRIKNVIAPEHIRRKGGSPPCTITGRCHDCRGEKRICAVTTIIEHKPLTSDINVVIVNQDLGLSWDRSWPQERIDAIVKNHERFMCPLPKEAVEKTDIKALWQLARNKTKGMWLLREESDYD